MAWAIPSGTENEQEALEKSQRENTGAAGAAKAKALGEMAALAVGANQGQAAAQAAGSAGATKGQAESLAGNIGNAATQNAIASKTEEATKANQEEVENKQKQLEEAEAAQAEQLGTIDKVGAVNNALGTTALTAAGTALGGPVVGAIGAGLGSAVNAGRQALLSKWGKSDNKYKRGIAAIGSMLLSDERAKILEERCGYHSKIKDERLLHLLEELKDEQSPESSNE